jgi:long-chain acyl-CoA synthetase
VTIPIYPTYPPDLIEYIVNDAGVKTLIVEDPTQLAKVLEVDKSMPGLEHIVIMQGYEGREPSPRTFTWEALQRLGREKADSLKAELAKRVDGIKREDVATIVYTSGTTGPPKGVVQTHGNHLSALESRPRPPRSRRERSTCSSCPSRTPSRGSSPSSACTGASARLCREHRQAPGEPSRDPASFHLQRAAVFEKVYAGAMARAEGGSPVKRKIFNWAVGVGKDVSRLKQANRTGAGGPRLPVQAGREARLLEDAGRARRPAALRRLRGAPLAREIAEFFHAAGILILEGYGLTETCPVLTNNREDAYKFGSVGKAMPGVDVKIAADGEILGRGGNIAKGYFKKPEATREVFLDDGWFATGDIGRFDDDGFSSSPTGRRISSSRPAA